MTQDTLSDLNDLFISIVESLENKLSCPDEEDVRITANRKLLKSAMHLLMFMMEKDNYAVLVAIDNGKLVRNYLLGVIQIMNDDDENDNGDSWEAMLQLFAGENEIASIFPPCSA